MKPPKASRDTPPLPKNPAIDYRKYTKLQAAEEQLNAAIRLYFTFGNELAIHTLARAAIGILEPLCVVRGLGDLSMMDHIVPAYQGRWRATIEEAQNFLKHGSKDANATLEFWPEWNEINLLMATEGHLMLTKGTSFETRCFRRWIGIRKPDILRSPLPNANGLQAQYPVAARINFFSDMFLAESISLGTTLPPQVP